MYDLYELEEQNMKHNLRDWRKALRTPATYRVGNTVRIQPQFVFLIGIIGAFLLVLFYYNWSEKLPNNSMHTWNKSYKIYNNTYPLTAAYQSGDVIKYKIGIVTDLDKNSKSKTKPNTYISYLKKGVLSYNVKKKQITVSWEQSNIVLSSTYSHKGRGMELSELIVYDGRLLTFDDRSGMVFEIVNNKVVPWVILSDGNGYNEKGYKGEWATVKDEILYIGSMGKEWTTAAGEFETFDPMWVKAINIHGEVQHLNWISQFKAIRRSIGIEWPGYMIHESGGWSESQGRWFFLPRRCSREPYNETKDEVMGCNYLITADNSFNSVHAMQLSKTHNPKHGFSSFKFIPNTNDEVIVALKTTEFEGKTATYITAFKTDGTVLLEDIFIEALKYEGLEFI
ncbi:apyrase [Aricia agestis]|uniref:apyrase n=1 Tax=Aricia agestis TaxID=91739 RepID=UPI001C20B713|nr:apyrase [Aricia agestis]